MSNTFSKIIYTISLFFLVSTNISFAANPNQTDTTTPILSGDKLPFKVQLETAEFALPNGIHSGVSAVYGGKWLLLAGRTNGLHGFDSPTDNFPPQQQNSMVYVVDPEKRTVFFKSLYDPSSLLTQAQIDLLTVTSPQSYQDGKFLYMTGGYGVNTSTGDFSTKDALTAINIPKLMEWVLDTRNEKNANIAIRQIFNPLFQVTGGYMTKGADGLTLLIFGQNFTGFYTDSSNGAYLQQVNRFYIKNDGNNLSIIPLDPEPLVQDPNYRRRDLNVVPIVLKRHGHLEYSFVALSGVFTEATGIWTVPVMITAKGIPSMANPLDSSTFKQGMNNYVSATVGLFSKKHKASYTLLLGGISYGYYQNGQFQTDSEFPFINQVTTIKIDKHKKFSQYLMDAEYPLIYSTGSNPGNPLLFGAGAEFIPTNIETYKNGVIKLDELKKKKVLIGYVVGGIASSLPNTNTRSDSTASSYIFKVYLKRK